MKQLLEDAQKIKSLEIQGASNVAIHTIDYLSNYAKRLKCKNIEVCFKKLYEAQVILMDTRPTEPAMKNGLKFIMNKLEQEKETIIAEYISDIIESSKPDEIISYSNVSLTSIHESLSEIVTFSFSFMFTSIVSFIHFGGWFRSNSLTFKSIFLLVSLPHWLDTIQTYCPESSNSTFSYIKVSKLPSISFESFCHW